MVHKSEQLQIKALITEAITVLCKNGLRYRSKFSIEGLLGITLDDDDIFLVSIRELVQKNENGTLERQPQMGLDSEETAEKVALAQAQGLLLHQAHHAKQLPPQVGLHQQQQHQADKHVPIQHQHVQQQHPEQHSRPHTVHPLERVLLPSITGPTIVMSAGPTGSGPMTPQILSPQTLPFRALSVDQLTSASALSYRRTASLPHSQTSDQTSFSSSTVDSALGSSLSSHSTQPSPQIPHGRRRANSDQSEPPPKRVALISESSSVESVSGTHSAGAPAIIVKHEPLSDSEVEAPTSVSVESDLPTVSTPAYSVGSVESSAGCSSWPPSRMSVTPVQTVTTPATSSTQVLSGNRSQTTSHSSPHTNHQGTTRGQPVDSSSVCTLHRNILEQSGCIIFASSVVLQDGTKTHTRTNGHMVQAMQEMTYPLGHPRHVGQYKEVMAGRYSRKVFYKCPPEIIRQEILSAYGLTLKMYTKMFYSDVKPVTSSSKWFETVETLMLNFPYGPRLFPLQMMGLSEDQMRVLSMVRVYKENKQNHKQNT